MASPLTRKPSVERCVSFLGRNRLFCFICRLGLFLKAHVHFHYSIVDSVFEPAANADDWVEEDFHTTTWIDEIVIAKVQAEVRRRVLATFVRRGLIDKVYGECLCMHQRERPGIALLWAMPALMLDMVAENILTYALEFSTLLTWLIYLKDVNSIGMFQCCFYM